MTNRMRGPRPPDVDRYTHELVPLPPHYFVRLPPQPIQVSRAGETAVIVTPAAPDPLRGRRAWRRRRCRRIGGSSCMSMRMKMTEYGDYVAWPGARCLPRPGKTRITRSIWHPGRTNPKDSRAPQRIDPHAPSGAGGSAKNPDSVSPCELPHGRLAGAAGWRPRRQARVGENRPHRVGRQDGCDDPHAATTAGACQGVRKKDPLEQIGPRDPLSSGFCGLRLLLDGSPPRNRSRYHLRSPPRGRRQDAVVPRDVGPWPRHQRNQLFDQLSRRKQQVCCPVGPRPLQT